MTNPTESPRPGGTTVLAGRTVSRIGYGAMQLDRLRSDRDSAARLLRRAVELGVDHIDTAEFYGFGFMNEIIGEAVRPEDDVTIVTKVGWEADGDGPMPLRLAQRPEQLRESVEQNLRSLRMDQLPVVNLRRTDAGPTLPAPADQIIDLDDQLAELLAMRDEGVIGDIGLSTVSLEVLERALPAGLVCVSHAYSLVDRTAEALLDLCVANGITWVPYFPLGSAFPGFPKVADEKAVRSIAAELSVTPAQVGLAWLLHRTPDILLIPGTASIGHLEANIAAGDICLDSDMLDELDQVSSRSSQQ